MWFLASGTEIAEGAPAIKSAFQSSESTREHPCINASIYKVISPKVFQTFFKIEIELIYNVVLVSGVQQSD